MCVNGWESEYDFSTNACESRPNTLNVINPEKSLYCKRIPCQAILVATANEDVIDRAEFGER